jgi:hypothetical protein
VRANAWDRSKSGGKAARTCIFRFVRLGYFIKSSQAGVTSPPAGGEVTARAGTYALCLRLRVRRFGAGSARALCPKLEPLLERAVLNACVARISQV